MKENGEKASSFHPSEAKDHLHTTLSDLFFAGSETTSSTLSWAILFMIRHPDVQDKVREEIHRVVGRDWLPTLADRTAMVYTEATIMEVQRMGNIGERFWHAAESTPYSKPILPPYVGIRSSSN